MINMYSVALTDLVEEFALEVAYKATDYDRIRLTVEDAKWLYEHCKRGSLAIIIY
jgi:hypothetical protein